jgi:hypothetical protein
MKAANDNQRLLTRGQAAAYCGYSSGQFSRLVTNGTLPPSVGRLRRWDKAVLDAKLDELSGIKKSETPEDEFDKWERDYNARKSQGRG